MTILKLREIYFVSTANYKVIEDLAQSMGAKIDGLGSNLLTITGVNKLNGTEHTVLPDMIEIGSWIGLAAMTKSEILIKNVSWENLGQIPNVFNSLGIELLRVSNAVFVRRKVIVLLSSWFLERLITFCSSKYFSLLHNVLSGD